MQYSSYTTVYMYNDQSTESRIATTGRHCSCHGTNQLEHAYWQGCIANTISNTPSGMSNFAPCIHDNTPGTLQKLKGCFNPNMVTPGQLQFTLDTHVC